MATRAAQTAGRKTILSIVLSPRLGMLTSDRYLKHDDQLAFMQSNASVCEGDSSADNTVPGYNLTRVSSFSLPSHVYTNVIENLTLPSR